MKCWYCSVREAEDKDTYKLDMHGEVAAQNVDSQTSVAYNVRHIEVPRCSDCHSKHKVAKFMHFMSIVFTVALVGGVVTTLFGWLDPLIEGIWCGLAAGLVIAFLMSGALVQKGIHTLRSSRSQFPEIKDLLGQCYRFGSRPKEAVPKSDPPCEPVKKDDNQPL